MNTVVRVIAAILMLHSTFIWAGPEDRKSTSIRAHDRALCVSTKCTITSEVDKAEQAIPFGTLFKVSQIKDDRCLVYNDFVNGWIDIDKLASLSDTRLPKFIQESSAAPAHKEFALGNYYSRRDLVKAKRHFQKSIAIDANFDHAYVELIQILAVLGDDKEIERTLSGLKRFPHREDVFLAFTIQKDPSEEVLLRCNEVMKTSPFLKIEMANFLLSQNDERLLATASEFAMESFSDQKLNPWRSHVLAMIYYAMLPAFQEDQALSRKATQMATALWVESSRNDHHYSVAYECLALIQIAAGKQGEAIRLAQAALRVNPRSHVAASIIGRFAEQVKSGYRFHDAVGTEIEPDEILPMTEVERGLKRIAGLDLALLPSDRREEEERLHGHTDMLTGRTVNDEGDSPLHLLVKDRNGVCINYLASAFQLDWNVTNAAGFTPLQLAISDNNLVIVSGLVNNGADVNFKASDKTSPLAMACETGNSAIIASLMRSNHISSTELQKLRVHFRTEQDSSLTKLRQVATKKLKDELEHIVQSKFLDLVNGLELAVSQLKTAQEQQRHKEDWIPLSNSPVFVPGYIDDIRKDNPIRANILMNQRIAEEAQEQFELYNYERELATAKVESSEGQVAVLREELSASADQIMLIAYLALSAEDYADFAKKTGAKIESVLRSASITWRVPYTAETR